MGREQLKTGARTSGENKEKLFAPIPLIPVSAYLPPSAPAIIFFLRAPPILRSSLSERLV